MCHMTTSVLPDPVEIGRRLLSRRRELHLDQGDVAERAGVSRPYLSRLERGAVPNPKLYELAQVAAALNIPVTALVSSPDARTLHIAEGEDVMAALADLPDETASSVLSAMRQILEIAQARDAAARS